MRADFLILDHIYSREVVFVHYKYTQLRRNMQGILK